MNIKTFTSSMNRVKIYNSHCLLGEKFYLNVLIEDKSLFN